MKTGREPVTVREEVQVWIAQRAAEDNRLYEKYGRALESEHRGEFVAISSDGQIITGGDELAVAAQAVERFGPGTFALRRVGADHEIRRRRPLL